MRLFLQIIIFLFSFLLNSYAQNFPSPASLSTGQGALGADDPNWQVSQQCYITGSEPNPTNASVTYSPAIILSSVPPVWIDPSTLPAPVNNGNWIGVNASAGNDDGGGCARYYRLTLDLPANCGTVSVTNAGAYSLTFDGYVDNTLMAVYLNGVNQGVPSGGSFTAGGQVTFTIPGPWLVGTNYIDVLVENGAGGSPNPAGFLMVASPSAASTDSDGDGINNLNDVCPCEAGITANGCPPPNQCNVAAIRSAYLGAGCTELFTCYDGCSLYFYYPTAGSSQAAETFAQTLGGHVVSIQSATENACLQSELSSHGYSGVIWLGYTDDITEGSFYWLDGSPIGYTNWSAGEPNNAGGNENCVQMYPDGYWNDLDCSSGAASILEVGLCPQATITSNTLQICNGSSATLSVTTAFGSAPYNYTWTPNIGLSTNTSSNPIASPSVSTNYTVQSVDRYGCTAYAYVTLTVNPTPALTVNSATICLGVQAATLIVSGSNSYSWSPPTDLSSSTGSLVVGNPTATINSYTVTGLTTLGCVSSATTFINVNSLPNILVSPTSSSICIGQQSSTLTASGAVVYSWTPSTGLSSSTGSNVVADPTITTTYSVGGIDGFGCPNYTTITIGVNSLPILSVNNTSICLGQQTATLLANGGLTYTWTPPTGLSTLTGSVVLANPNASTTYSIIGTDANGCFNNTTTSLTVIQLPNISSNSASICIGQQSATLSATGALSYTWIPTSNLSPPTGSMVVANPTVNTTYTVVGIDMNGCYNYSTSTVSMNALPTLIVNSSTICIGQQSATLIVNGANTYTWTPNLNLSSATGSMVVASPSVTNNYTVLGTDLNGCVNFVSNTITVLPLPILSANSATICMGQQTATLTAGGANTYTWLPNFSTGSIITVMPLTNSTYTVVGQDLSGCLNYTVANVTVLALPVLSVNNASICLGQQTATLLANGGLTYTWTPPAGLSTLTGSVVLANPNVSTTYSIIGTDANGCFNNTTTSLTVIQLPNISSNSASICIGQQSATLSATGALSYTWIPTSNLSPTTGSMVVANPTVNTTYTVVGIDMNGCYNYSTSTVSMNALPTLIVNSSTICIGQQSATLIVNGANTYTWTPNLNLSSTTGSMVVASPSVTNNYTITGIDLNGCINFVTNTITVLPLPILSVNNATICMGQQTATLTAGGANTYTWLPNFSTGSTITVMPLTNGTYTVVGQDLSGCLNYTVSNVSVLALPVLSVNNASICLGQQTATLLANGGVTYTWSPAASLSSSSGSIVTTSPSATSTYTLIGTDNNNCYNVITSTVTIYQLPVISVNNTSVCPGQFPANLLPTGASTYTWNPTVTYNQANGSDVDANPSVPTTYTVTGIDNNGCFNTTSTNVGFYLIPTASLTVSDSILCLGESFILKPSGGTSTKVLPDNLISSNNFTLSPTTTSSYTIIVFNANGCYSTNDPVVTITVNTLPTIAAFSNTIINIGQSTSINASGGLTYIWNPSDGLSCSTCVTTKASPLESTTYTVTGFDINGCASTNTVYVQVDYVCGDYFVPNVFSPNGDGKNDYVNLHSSCVGTYTLQIFDRWGEKVFESSDVNYSWDGYYRGKPMDTGVFVYKATGFDIKGTAFSIKGNITLLR